MILGSFERWRLHMHQQHFDKLGGAYDSDEVVPCYWCCRPCVTELGQGKLSNRLPFWSSHERVCRENPSKTAPPVSASAGKASPGYSAQDGTVSGCSGRGAACGAPPPSRGRDGDMRRDRTGGERVERRRETAPATSLHRSEGREASPPRRSKTLEAVGREDRPHGGPERPRRRAL